MNSQHTRRIAALLAASAIAVPGTLALAAAPAHADTERRGACGTGTYEFSVDREDGGYEVDAQLDGLPRGQRWKLVLRHEGKVVKKVVRAADYEGEIDAETRRAGTPGSETFRMVATRVGGGGKCAAKITTA